MSEPPGRRRLRLLAIVVCAAIAGALVDARVLDGPWRNVPTGGLVYFGVFFVVAGLVHLVPGVWRRQAGSSAWLGKTLFGAMPPREELPGWRRGLWDIQEWVIARERRRNEAMQRDPRPAQLLFVVLLVSAGVTFLSYAALR